MSGPLQNGAQITQVCSYGDPASAIITAAINEVSKYQSVEICQLDFANLSFQHLKGCRFGSAAGLFYRFAVLLNQVLDSCTFRNGRKSRAGDMVCL
jgi:hypothetical protein